MIFTTNKTTEGIVVCFTTMNLAQAIIDRPRAGPLQRLDRLSVRRLLVNLDDGMKDDSE